MSRGAAARLASSVAVIAALLLGVVPVAKAAETLRLTLSPPSGPNGTLITLDGSGAPPGSQVSYIYGSFANLDQCLNNRTSGQGVLGTTTTADGAGNFQMTHQAAEGASSGAIRFVVYTPSGATSPWACFEIADNAITFSETGKTARGAFLDYWRLHGGLIQQGYPITDEFAEVNPSDGKTYAVQYFERARFEYHPENTAPYNVLLGLLGGEQYKAKYGGGTVSPFSGDPFPGYQGSRECATFSQTGIEVCGAFLSYWQSNGGLAQQGLPLSPLFVETNPTDGRQYVTQYFERARFEFHPENANRAGQVLLGLLGREQYQAKYAGPTLLRSETLTNSALPSSDTPRALAGPTPAGYRMLIRQSDSFFAFYFPLTNGTSAGPADTRTEIEFSRATGPTDGTVAIGCRGVKGDLRRSYRFEIAPESGYYRIGLWLDENNFRSLVTGQSPAAQVRGAWTRLRADCIGDTLTLYVNDQQIARARDTTLGVGNAVLFTTLTYTTGGMDVTYRNLRVSTATASATVQTADYRHVQP